VLAVRLLEDYLVIPRVMGHSVGLSPLVVLVSVTTVGILFGGFAVILAIPIASVVVGGGAGGGGGPRPPPPPAGGPPGFSPPPLFCVCGGAAPPPRRSIPNPHSPRAACRGEACLARGSIPKPRAFAGGRLREFPRR
jgi:hypothetical protein